MSLVKVEIKLAFVGLLTAGVIMVGYLGYPKLNEALIRGLEEEKSFTRRAMEYHRRHPEKRAGDNVLDTWSTADYIALAVVQQKRPGDWAALTDRLQFLPTSLKKDSEGLPFCVIQQQETILVIRFLSSDVRNTCTFEFGRQVGIPGIESGDMEFSGRTDYWIYLLRVTQANQGREL